MFSKDFGFTPDWSANELANMLPSDNRKMIVLALDTIQEWALEGENYISNVDWAVFYDALERLMGEDEKRR